MKKLVPFLLVVILPIISIAQQTKDDYLVKSKNQKTTAWVLLGGGVAMGVGAAAWAGSNWESTGPDVLFVIAGAAIIASIPLFIASGRNKRRAVSMTFKNERMPSLQKNSFAYKDFPSLSLKVRL